MSVPIGGIIAWNDALGTIPAGWQLCDGTGGTPDLRDRFVIGAGSIYTPGDTGGANVFVVPAHTHASPAPSTLAGTSHNHGTIAYETPPLTAPAVDAAYGDPALAQVDVPSPTGHTHIWDIVLSNEASHKHLGGTGTLGTASAGTVTRLPYYYALYFIQRLV
jgi:hypothetical protein